MSVRITQPRDGDILNRRHGTATAAGLRIEVRGTCPAAAAVTVNGQPATVAGSGFQATVCLTQPETVLRAAAADGAAADTVTVLWDRHSFPRYRFSLDDNVWFLRDLAQQRCRSLFDNPYLALWKRLHDTYGTRFVCNIYYQCDGFDLSMMPATWRSQWADNADWFRLTFHALQNDPDRPYLHATAEQIGHDYDLITGQILRFAGPEVMDTFTTIHWGEAPVEACRAVRDRGIRGLCGYFVLEKGEPRVSYYLDAEQTAHLARRDYWKDTREGLIFVRHAAVCNAGDLTPERIGPHLAAIAANPGQGEVLELMIHEQYFHRDFRAYEPDYAARCEAAVRWVTENGYRPVYWSDGFVGAPV